MTTAELLKRQREFFESGSTRSEKFRREQILKLAATLRAREGAIMDALKADLHKPDFEAWAGELGFLLDEIGFTLKNLHKWMKHRRVRTPVLHAIASSRIVPEPLGIVLVIAPWNYPLMLALSPLIGAMAAGNCAVVKPSELTPETAKLLASLVRETFPPEYIAVVEGGVNETTELLTHRFDHIFFTGSTAVGKVVMAAAAKHLTPVTLELGGKSPCIVADDAPEQDTLRRIIWGKFFNAGQTCVAPDYVLVPEKMKSAFVDGAASMIRKFYGDDPMKSPDYARIVSDRHFARLSGLLKGQTVATGGTLNSGERYIAPTLLTDVSPDAPVMKEEIFGPILPVMTYSSLDEAEAFVRARPKPLAFYLFSRSKAVQERILKNVPFGGGCINDTVIHLSTPWLPFGGVGDSGMGAYHGRTSFETFSHMKSVLTRSFLIDPPVRYPAYKGKLGLLKWLLH